MKQQIKTSPDDFNMETLEAACYLGITTFELLKLVNEQKIPFQQVGRNKMFSKTGLLSYKEGQCTIQI